MTSYNTPLEFRTHAFPTGSFARLSDAEIQMQLDVANSDIQSALEAQMTPPLATVPAVLADAERVMAAWRLLLFKGGRPTAIDSTLQQRYYEIVGNPDVPGSGMLYRIATGKMVFARGVDSTLVSRGGPIVVAGRDRGGNGGWGVA